MCIHICNGIIYVVPNTPSHACFYHMIVLISHHVYKQLLLHTIQQPHHECWTIPCHESTTNMRSKCTHHGPEVSKINYSTEVRLSYEQNFTISSPPILNSLTVYWYPQSVPPRGFPETDSNCIHIQFLFILCGFLKLWLQDLFYFTGGYFVPVTSGYLWTSTLLLLVFCQL